MNKIRCSAFVIAVFTLLFAQPLSTTAQGVGDPFVVDSFFDVFMEIELPDPLCDPCKALEEEIAELKGEIEDIEADLEDVKEDLDALGDDIKDAEEDLEDAKAELEEFLTPTNYVEDDQGRRYDSSDNAAMRRRSASLWGDYQSGDLTAQEYSDEVGKSFHDPDVQAELEKIKKEIKKELKQDIEDLNEELDDLNQEKDDLNEDAKNLTDDLESALDRLEELLKHLEDCRKRCKEKEKVSIPEDYGIGQEQHGFFEGFFGWFGGFFGGGDVPLLPAGDTDTIVRRLGFPDLGLPPSGDVPIELVALQLQSVEPVADSFFDVFIEIQLPDPVCHICDSIRKDLGEKADECAKLRAERAVLQAQLGAVNGALDVAKDTLKDGEKALDEFNKPRNYVEDDQGRRYDSSDNAAMRRRNAGLWGDYKNGDLSAQELSDEWGKSFHDPDVQAELEKIKKQIREEMEQQIKNLKKNLKDLEAKKSELEQKIRDLDAKIKDCEKQQKDIEKRLDDCNKKCTLIPKDEPPKVLIDFGGFIFEDGFESGDITRWSNAPSTSSAQQSSVKADADVTADGTAQKPQTSFACDWFGVFCPKESLPTLDDFADCVIKRSSDPFCTDNFDQNGDGQTTTVDIELVALSLRSVEPITVDFGGTLSTWDVQIDLSGMDGNPGSMSVQDLQLGSDCLGGGSCNGLDFTPPPGLPGLSLDDARGLSGNDFLPQLTGGNDLILGGPLPDDFIGAGGLDNLGPGPGQVDIPADFFGPGSDPFSGDLQLFGNTDNADGPPLVLPPPSAQNVPQNVQDIIDRIIRDNPLEPCEQLIIVVRRLRIGNKVRYTVTATRTRNEEKCPPAQCPSHTSYQSIGVPSAADCSATCQNGAGGCVVIETLPDGTSCILCGPPEDEVDDLCEDIDCDDGDECTSDECNSETGECVHIQIDGCGEQDEDPLVCPELSYVEKSDCEGICRQNPNAECKPVNPLTQGTDKDCWACVPKSQAECSSDAAFETREACNSSCDGACGLKWVYDKRCYGCRLCPTSPSWTDARLCEGSCDGVCESKSETVNDIGIDCYICKEREDLPPPKVECDSPTKTESSCRNSCDGTCTKSYTRSDGVKCFECIENDVAVCPADSVATCGDCPSNTECDIDNGCAFCVPVVDDGSACPSDTTSDQSVCESQCPSDGNCTSDDNGCYSCLVVSCPSGTFKDQCPSSCSNGCDVAAEQSGVSCYQCKQNCEDVCAENGYGPENTDHSNAILSELNQYECVSGAGISIQTATIGSCNCIGDYTLTIDTTPPVCAGTPCGDVQCNSSATCAGGPGETITVTCNWGGWEKIQKHQFRPVVGD